MSNRKPSKASQEKKLHRRRNLHNSLTIAAVDDWLRQELYMDEPRAAPHVPAEQYPSGFGISFLGLAWFFRTYILDRLEARGMRSYDLWLEGKGGDAEAKLRERERKKRALIRVFLLLCEARMWRSLEVALKKPFGYVPSLLAFDSEMYSDLVAALENIPRPIVRLIKFVGKFTSLRRVWIPTPLIGSERGVWQFRSCLWSNMTEQTMSWFNTVGIPPAERDGGVNIFETAFNFTMIQMPVGAAVPPPVPMDQTGDEPSRKRVCPTEPEPSGSRPPDQDRNFIIPDADIGDFYFDQLRSSDLKLWGQFKNHMMERVNWVENATLDGDGSPGQIVTVEGFQKEDSPMTYFTQTAVTEAEMVLGISLGTGFNNVTGVPIYNNFGLGPKYCYQSIKCKGDALKAQVAQLDGPIHPV